jgi:hypothetical protein
MALALEEFFVLIKHYFGELSPEPGKNAAEFPFLFFRICVSLPDRIKRLAQCPVDAKQTLKSLKPNHHDLPK